MDSPAVQQPLVDNFDQNMLCKPGLSLSLCWLRLRILRLIPVLVLVLLMLTAALLVWLC